MGEIIKTKYTDSEISKVQDFDHTADSPVEILNAVLQGSFDDVVNSFVVSGMSVRQLAIPSMNVEIAPGLAFDRNSDKLIHLATAISVPVEAAHASLDRVDTLEVRYLETDFDSEVRAFKNPVNGTVSYAPVNTKTKVSMEGRCLAGAPGAGIAPAAEPGWVKLAEVFVAATAVAIFNADIRNLTAAIDATDNAAWTAEKQRTFSLGSAASIKKAILDHAAEIATQAASVHGIRQGSANGFDADMLDGKHADAAATADTVFLRGAGGRGKVGAPVDADDVARKAEVDAEAALARNADNLSSGTVNLDRIPATLTGKDADTLDGKHASGFVASTYTSQTINKTNSLNTNIADMSVGECKTVTKTGTGNGPISTPSGSMFAYRNSLGGSGVVGGGASVYADAATGSIVVLKLA
jgi:hypothetical protein